MDLLSVICCAVRITLDYHKLTTAILLMITLIHELGPNPETYCLRAVDKSFCMTGLKTVGSRKRTLQDRQWENNGSHVSLYTLSPVLCKQRRMTFHDLHPN